VPGGAVSLVGLTKRFGDFTAVAGIDLDIPGGEFFSLLGPSGCGKTTTLRMIGGFEKPTTGRILLDGIDMTETSAHRRPVNTVFQSYALFPHLDVFDNVAFGLRRARVAKNEVRRRVAATLQLVGLTGMERRKPIQLSGGQQQRVALARALVLEPAVLLLDEPLGALDAKLRKTLQTELKALQETVGITFVYVTHDQEEALTMSDRIAVMADGRVEQLGAPREVYEEPANVFVADFLGVANLIRAPIIGPDGDGACRVRLGEAELRAAAGRTATRGEATLVVRPERVRLEEHGSAGPNQVPGMVERVIYLGASVQVVVRLAAGGTVQALVQSTNDGLSWRQGTPVQAHLPAEALRVLGSDEPKAEG
jgi:spermidine/putrescine transport system ATP-binding protein